MARSNTSKNGKAPRIVEDEDDQVDGVEAVAAEPDELEQLLSRLQGGAVYTATVYRLDDSGREERLLRMPLRSDADPDDIWDRIQKAHGGGEYRLQLRAPGQHGTIGNATARLAGSTLPVSAVGPSSPAPAPSAPDPLLQLLLKRDEQHQQLMHDMLTRQTSLAPAAPAANLNDQMTQLAGLFRFARAMSRASGEVDLPPWLTKIGQVAAPVMATVAEHMNKAANRAEQRVDRAGQQPARKPVENQAEPEPDNTDALEQAIQGILRAAAAEPAPDVERYATIIWNVAPEVFSKLAESVPDGALAAAVADQVPGLKDKTEFCRQLETALRARCSQAAPPKE